jgi:hypothetical protein
VTYSSHVSVALILSASESAAAPASPKWLPSRLLRGEEGQGCSTGPRAQSRKRATYSIVVSKLNAFASLSLFLPLLSSSSTIASASIFPVAPIPALVPPNLSLLVVRLSLRASVYSTLHPRQDAQTPIARHERDVLGVRTRPARLSASDPQGCRRSLERRSLHTASAGRSSHSVRTASSQHPTHKAGQGT